MPAAGLIIVGAAAGAPFLPKLVQVAKGDAAFSVGLMILLMVVAGEMGKCSQAQAPEGQSATAG